VALSQADIEHRRGRLLAWVCLILCAFAALAVLFSFLGPWWLTVIQGAPAAARVGILLLTLGFIALVWEKERSLRSLLDDYNNKKVLTASFENRLQVLRALLEAGDRLNAPLGMDDVVRVILDAALDLADAEDGSIEVLDAHDGGGLMVTQSHSVSREPGATEPGKTAWLTLRVGEREIAIMSITRRAEARPFNDETIEILERFSQQAAHALDKARQSAQDRASIAYLEAANLVKSRFLATVSHELRTPLTSVIGYSATLENHWEKLSDPQKRDFVREIHVQGRKLHRLVERVLEAARIEIEGGTINPVRHDVRMSVKGALLTFGAENERLELRVPSTPLEADADPAVIEQVVSNLVDNALRYTDGHVTVSLDAMGNRMTLSVADEGPGVSLEMASVRSGRIVLDPHHSQGAGLGLHIVQTLVEDHGGSVELRPDPGLSSIVVTLPRRAETALKRGSLVQPNRSRI
jgi:signal transduction histidine kinase